MTIRIKEVDVTLEFIQQEQEQDLKDFPPFLSQVSVSDNT